MVRCVRRTPWRLLLLRPYTSSVLFFGTDDFSLGSLKALHKLQKRRMQKKLSRFSHAFWKRISSKKSLKQQTNLIHKLDVVSCMKPRFIKKKKYFDIPDVLQYAQDHGLALLEWDTIKTEKRFKESYDLGFVSSFGDFIPATILNQFSRGIVNIHPSLLPRWRGASPITYTILAGDQISGISFIQLSKNKFDGGKIIYQKSIKVAADCNNEELKLALKHLSGEMTPYVVEHFDELMKNATTQDESQLTVAPKISKALGHFNVDDQTCEEVEKLQRALPIKVGIRALWADKPTRLGKVVNMLPLTDADWNLVNGSCVYCKQDGVIQIKLKDGWIHVKSLQVHCKKEVTAQQFYNGYIVDKQTGRISTTKFHSILITQA